MNSSGLAGNSLTGTPLEPIEALSRASAGVSVSSRVGDVSSVDDNPLSTSNTDGSGLVSHSAHGHGAQHNSHHGIPPHHSLHHQHGHAGGQHPGGFQQLSQGNAILPFQETQLKIVDTITKMENEVATVNQDMAYFRHLLDFQNSKIEKLTSLLIDLLHNKDVAQIVNSLQVIQASDPFNVDDAHDSVDDSLAESVRDSVHDPVHDVTSGIPALSSPGVVSVGGAVGVPGVSLESNMDPQLHQVAQAAVQAQAKSDIHHGKRMRKRPFSKINNASANNHNSANNNGNSINANNGNNASVNNTNNGTNGTSSSSSSNNSSNNSSNPMLDRMSKHHSHLRQQLQSSQNQHPQQQQQQQAPQHTQHQQQQQHTQHQQQPQHQQQQQHPQHQQQVQRQQTHTQQPHGQMQDRTSPSQQQSQQQQQQIHQDQQSEDAKRSMSEVDMPGLEVVSMDNMSGRKKPKVTIDFLHNPMTVKEIYDEFTVGFRGQPPLREMDERYGKHEWRGDSRSKESKRFQRRKKLCDAIERGMQKYGKTAEEIQEFIEEFRGDKSLTWVMNGNLPSDLME